MARYSLSIPPVAERKLVKSRMHRKLALRPLRCRFGLPERLGNGLNDYGSNVAYVICDSGFQFRQDGVQLALSLGGDGPISE